ncbi:hypothetical protein NM208_g10720 [Fusarium decemcellulare]|uniref:Uncharacterized protein n=1 Tax=Fusarium decemcellulare TaxID=57161 RepID=A0ACC1RWW6_9HYPO|nr:hypothetical protein NM208_g10720 [Fusarium decemcellulare]
MFNIISTPNQGATVGRVTIGLLSDKMGRINVVFLFESVAAIVAFGLLLNMGSSKAMFYVFVSPWGFSIGAIHSTMPVLAGQLCQKSDFGMYYGTNSLVISFALGALERINGQVGWDYSLCGSARWILYIGGTPSNSLALGVHGTPNSEAMGGSTKELVGIWYDWLRKMVHNMIIVRKGRELKRPSVISEENSISWLLVVDRYIIYLIIVLIMKIASTLFLALASVSVGIVLPKERHQRPNDEKVEKTDIDDSSPLLEVLSVDPHFHLTKPKSKPTPEKGTKPANCHLLTPNRFRNTIPKGVHSVPSKAEVHENEPAKSHDGTKSTVRFTSRKNDVRVNPSTLQLKPKDDQPSRTETETSLAHRIGPIKIPEHAKYQPEAQKETETKSRHPAQRDPLVAPALAAPHSANTLPDSRASGVNRDGFLRPLPRPLTPATICRTLEDFQRWVVWLTAYPHIDEPTSSDKRHDSNHWTLEIWEDALRQINEELSRWSVAKEGQYTNPMTLERLCRADTFDTLNRELFANAGHLKTQPNRADWASCLMLRKLDITLRSYSRIEWLIKRNRHLVDAASKFLSQACQEAEAKEKQPTQKHEPARTHGPAQKHGSPQRHGHHKKPLPSVHPAIGGIHEEFTKATDRLTHTLRPNDEQMQPKQGGGVRSHYYKHTTRDARPSKGEKGGSVGNYDTETVKRLLVKNKNIRLSKQQIRRFERFDKRQRKAICKHLDFDKDDSKFLLDTKRFEGKDLEKLNRLYRLRYGNPKYKRFLRGLGTPDKAPEEPAPKNSNSKDSNSKKSNSKTRRSTQDDETTLDERLNASEDEGSCGRPHSNI